MTEQGLPFVSIIIPVYNDSERLKVCLEALENQDYPDDLYEVIVVDNASKEPVEPVTDQFARARRVYEGKPGPDGARNAGVREAKGDYYAFVDSDCIPYPDWLAKGADWLMKNPDAGLIGGRVDVFPKDPKDQTLVELYESVYAFPTKLNIESHHFMPTCNMFTSKRIFEAVGPFNDQLKTAGDEEWGQRVYAHNYPLIYADDVAIKHPARHTFQDIFKKIRRIAFGYTDQITKESGKHALLLWKYWRRLFILPTPYELRELRDSDLNLTNKLKVLYVVLVSRTYRAYQMILTLFPQRDHLW